MAPWFLDCAARIMQLPLLEMRKTSPVAQMVKNLPAMRRPWFDLWVEKIPREGNGYPLPYSCWRIPWTEEPGELQSMGSQRVRHELSE